MLEINAAAEKVTHCLSKTFFFDKVTIFDVIERDNMLVFPNSFAVNNGLPSIHIPPSKKTKENCDFI